MNTILCATDLSPRAALAVDRAAALARQFGIALRLLHVVDDDQPRTIVDLEIAGARAVLSTQAEGLGIAAEAGVEILVKAGCVFKTIVSTAGESDADLVVMGAHRRRLLKDVVVGTTLERVVRTGSCPVLMVNSATRGRYESVLLALDGSTASARAVAAAKSLRMLDDVRLSAISAFEPIYKSSLDWAGAQQATITEYTEAWATKARNDIASLLGDAGMTDATLKILTDEGPPAATIKRAVERLQPQLLVIGTHGRSGIKRALLGSVAGRIISEVECDILVVPSARAA